MRKIRTILLVYLAIGISSANAYDGQRIWECSGTLSHLYEDGTTHEHEDEISLNILESGFQADISGLFAVTQNLSCFYLGNELDCNFDVTESDTSVSGNMNGNIKLDTFSKQLFITANIVLNFEGNLEQRTAVTDGRYSCR